MPGAGNVPGTHPPPPGRVPAEAGTAPRALEPRVRDHHVVEQGLVRRGLVGQDAEVMR